MGQTSRVSKNNTKVIKDANGNPMEVVLHGTSVIKFDDKTITLNSGGWRTATTRTRINQACSEYGLDCGISQVKGEWYAVVSGVNYPFYDGMVLAR